MSQAAGEAPAVVLHIPLLERAAGGEQLLDVVIGDVVLQVANDPVEAGQRLGTQRACPSPATALLASCCGLDTLQTSGQCCKRKLPTSAKCKAAANLAASAADTPKAGLCTADLPLILLINCVATLLAQHCKDPRKTPSQLTHSQGQGRSCGCLLGANCREAHGGAQMSSGCSWLPLSAAANCGHDQAAASQARSAGCSCRCSPAVSGGEGRRVGAGAHSLYPDAGVLRKRCVRPRRGTPS